jgi:hypothetical protein
MKKLSIIVSMFFIGAILVILRAIWARRPQATSEPGSATQPPVGLNRLS